MADRYEQAALNTARKLVEYFDYHNKNLNRKQDEVIDNLRNALDVIDKRKAVEAAYRAQDRFLADKRIALDGKEWWCAWDRQNMSYSGIEGLRGKHRTQYECKVAIVVFLSKHPDMANLKLKNK